MPIKDFAGRSRIPRLGKIRLGIKVKGEKSEYPKSVDYFVCPIEVRAVYGDKPKKLQIAFHSDELGEVFPQYYKRYGRTTGLVCKGDGDIANCINTETGEFEETECLGRECDFYKENKCKTIGNLYFMIRGVNRFGVYQLDTSSYNSILNVNGGIEYAKKLTGGRLAILPFILEVIPQEVSPKGKKKTVYVLRLEANINKMMKSLDLKPQEIFALEEPKKLESKDIEEDLHKEELVSSIKPTPSKLREMWRKVREAGIKEEKFRDDWLIGKYGVEHSKNLNNEQLKEIIQSLEKIIKEKKSKIDIEKPIDSDLGIMFVKRKGAGYTKEKFDKYLLHYYEANTPMQLTKAQYDEIIKFLDKKIAEDIEKQGKLID